MASQPDISTAVERAIRDSASTLKKAVADGVELALNVYIGPRLSETDMRVIRRALGAFASDYETGRYDQDGDVRLAANLRERLERWKP